MSFWVAMVVWVIGIVFMFGGKIADNLLRHLEKKLHEKSKKNVEQDHSAHMAYGTGRSLVDMIPWFTINSYFIILGMVIVALGFIPFSFFILSESIKFR